MVCNNQTGQIPSVRSTVWCCGGGKEEERERKEGKKRTGKNFSGGKLLVVRDWLGVFTPADKLVRRGKEKKMELLHKHSRFPHILSF